MIGRRISQPRQISKAQARAQLAMFLANARTLEGLTAADLCRRYNLSHAEIWQALEVARQVRGRLL